MFYHHRDALPLLDIDPPRVKSVRLLRNDEELQAAVERARAFERRDNYRQRRVDAYDRFLSSEEGGPPEAKSMTPIDNRDVVIVQIARTPSKTRITEGIENETTLKRTSGCGAALGPSGNTGQPSPLAS